MDRNQAIGLFLLFTLLMGWFYFTAPSAEEIEKQQRKQDSIAMAQKVADQSPSKTPEEAIYVPDESTETPSDQNAVSDTISTETTATPSQPQAQEYTLSNDKMTVTFSSKGGTITNILLHDYNKITEDAEHNEVKLPLQLMHDERNRFEFLLPIKGKGTVATKQIIFNASQSGNTITFTGNLGNGATLEQIYTISDTYEVDYQVKTKNLGSVLDAGQGMTFNWEQYLDKLEKNVMFEKTYSTVYFKPLDDDSDYCNCRSDDEVIEEKSIKWISHANQFFNTAIIGQNTAFKGGEFETIVLDDSEDRIKKVVSTAQMDLSPGDNNFTFKLYAGPNEFDALRSFDVGLEEVIPFGRSIFGAINRWVIRPSFNFLSQYIGSKGVVIIVLIFILKMLLYPLMYRMLYSQAKMSALKPKLAGLNEKFKDDPQKKQIETMSIYREYGVSPLGGCMPMIVQMPIWYALFRFFPASITFRQEPFLWATDLSSYDVIANLPFAIPAFGSHISLFTLLWAVSTVAYTYYNTRHMDMSANPAMKYVQYFMPLMFLFFFNNYASGLTCYMFFSNLFNIIQTVVTKRFVFDNDKILEELEEKKKAAADKPKTGFQARLEEAMKQQQQMQKKQRNKKRK